MTNATCTHPGCDKPFLARGMCRKHYYQAIRNGMETGSRGHVVSNAQPMGTEADCSECGPSVPVVWTKHGTKATCVVARQAYRDHLKAYRATQSEEATGSDSPKKNSCDASPS